MPVERDTIGKSRPQICIGIKNAAAQVHRLHGGIGVVRYLFSA
jgi:hypothetical protein